MRNQLFLKLTIALCIVLTSCVKVPSSTITLSEVISKEGQRMHELNLTLLNKIFSEKSQDIDVFIREKYTPAYIKDFKARIPSGTNIDSNFTDIIQAIIPVINARRDSMQTALEGQRIKLTSKLNSDFAIFQKASSDLNIYLKSAAKLSKEREEALNELKKRTNSKLDFNNIETKLDSFINKTGNIGENISNLDTEINALITE